VIEDQEGESRSRGAGHDDRRLSSTAGSAPGAAVRSWCVRKA
jgi:hypothetical protein